MKRKLTIILLFLLPFIAFAGERVIRWPSRTPVIVPSVSEVDAKLDLDGSNANTTINIGSENLVTTGILTSGGLVVGNITSTGDTYWTGAGSGIPYGEIYTDDNATTTVLASQDTWYDVTIFDTNGLSNLTTVDHTDDSIKIVKAGVYKVDISLDVRSAAANAYYFAAFKNKVAGTELHNLEKRRTTTVADKPGSLNMSGLVSLAVDDTISLGVQRKDGGEVSKSIVIEHINLTITMKGGN